MSILVQPEAVSPDFAEQVDDILALLHGRYEIDGVDAHAVLGEGAGLAPWIFGSSNGQSARVAGSRGLPFVASYHITPGTALEAIDAYRNAFTPSAELAEPYVVVSADVVVADDTTSGGTCVQLRALGLLDRRLRWGHSVPRSRHLPPLSDEQLAVVKDRTATQFIGDPDEVAERLEALQRVTGAGELVITSVTHRHADRLRSH
jgi:alkanesulfonate monooxygenase SsuD/methylene tetrahydromethanopterin reductase-like flavin-dependent oxidoreductase (luciferase family)